MARSTALLCLLALALFCNHVAATNEPTPEVVYVPEVHADVKLYGEELEEVVSIQTGKDYSTFSRYFDNVTQVFVARVVLQPCTAVQPHWHDTAETIYGLQNKVYVGVVGSDPFHPELSALEVKSGQFSVFPKDLLHFQYNPTCKKSVYLLQTCTKAPFVRFAAADLQTLDVDVQKAIYGKYIPNPDTELFVVDQACLKSCYKTSDYKPAPKQTDDYYSTDDEDYKPKPKQSDDYYSTDDEDYKPKPKPKKSDDYKPKKSLPKPKKDKEPKKPSYKAPKKSKTGY